MARLNQNFGSGTDIERLRLLAIINSSDDAIVSKDLDGTIRSWNPAAARIFGYTAEEMIGQRIFKIIPPELHDEEHRLLAKIRQGEHVAHYETERVRKDGRRVRVSLSLSPLRDDTGQLIGASAIKRDVTRQRMLELQLQQAQRMEAVGRLAGGIAHDFNNLLTIIGGMTGLAIHQLPADDAVRQDLEQVAKAAERATSLTQQLLTFSRRQFAEIEVLELGGVIRALLSLLRRLIGENIALHCTVSPDAGKVRANRAQIEQIIMNLVINARDAMPKGGTIDLAVRNVDCEGRLEQEQLQLEPGAYVVISVSDTGVGMDAVTQATIFEPFFTTKAAGSGTGLGLATVYAIVQQAGGAIYVYSEPDKGSVFKVYLPRVTANDDAAPAAAPPADAVDEDVSTGTVLLVEDEPGVRAFTARVLSDAGYTVLCAESGEEAIEQALEKGVGLDLLLTDVVMAGINGRVLAERARRVYPDLKVLYMSGYTDDMIVRTGVVAHGSAFIQKPFSPPQLLDRIRTMLRTRSVSRVNSEATG